MNTYAKNVRRMHQPGQERKPAPKRDYRAYLIANSFLKHLNANAPYMTPDRYKELREQALCGDINGAYKGLEEVLTKAMGEG